MNTPRRYQELLPPLWIITLISLAFVAWFAVQIKEILVLLVLGYSIAYVMEPAVSYFENKTVFKFKLGRPVSFFLIIALLCLSASVLIVTAIPTIAREYERLATQLPEYVAQAQTKLSPLITQAEQLLPQKFRPKELMQSPSQLIQYVSFESVKKFLGAVVSTFLGGYSLTLTLINLLLLPFIVFYLSMDFPLLHRRILLLFPRNLRLPVLKIANEIDRDVSAFVKAQLLVATILFVLYICGFWVIGIELALLLAVISGFGNIIPYIGTLTGVVLSSIIALVMFGDWSHLLQVWTVYLVVQLLGDNFITPRIMGQNVGLSPLVVLLALVISGQLFGLLGLLLAIPMTAVAKVLLKNLHVWMISREEVTE